jgi:hypothetical protein
VLFFFCGLFLFGFGFLLSEAEKRVDRKSGVVAMLALFKLFLTIDRVTCERTSLQTDVRDRLIADLTLTVSSTVDPLQGVVNLIKGILLLGKDAQGKIPVVGITSGIGLVHPERRGFASGVEIATCHPSHGVEEGILELQEALLLFFQKGGELGVFVKKRLRYELLSGGAIAGLGEI